MLWSVEQFYELVMQKPVKTGKYTEINKQPQVKFWLNWIKYGTLSYLSSCNLKSTFNNNWTWQQLLEKKELIFRSMLCNYLAFVNKQFIFCMTLNRKGLFTQFKTNHSLAFVYFLLFCLGSKSRVNYRLATYWPVHKLQLCKSILIEFASSR